MILNRKLGQQGVETGLGQQGVQTGLGWADGLVSPSYPGPPASFDPSPAALVVSSGGLGIVGHVEYLGIQGLPQGPLVRTSRRDRFS